MLPDRHINPTNFVLITRPNEGPKYTFSLCWPTIQIVRTACAITKKQPCAIIKGTRIIFLVSPLIIIHILSTKSMPHSSGCFYRRSFSVEQDRLTIFSPDNISMLMLTKLGSKGLDYLIRIIIIINLERDIFIGGRLILTVHFPKIGRVRTTSQTIFILISRYL